MPTVLIATPSLLEIFPTYHGLVRIHSVPSPHTLVSASERYSTLRGLSSSAGSPEGGSENNLAFKCTRKRLNFETLHLDLDGGIGERRTTPSTNKMSAGDTVATESKPQVSLATVEVELEEAQPRSAEDSGNRDVAPTEKLKSTLKKPKRKVAFQSERPDLYDF